MRALPAGVVASRCAVGSLRRSRRPRSREPDGLGRAGGDRFCPAACRCRQPRAGLRAASRAVVSLISGPWNTRGRPSGSSPRGWLAPSVRMSCQCHGAPVWPRGRPSPLVRAPRGRPRACCRGRRPDAVWRDGVVGRFIQALGGEGARRGLGRGGVGLRKDAQPESASCRLDRGGLQCTVRFDEKVLLLFSLQYRMRVQLVPTMMRYSFGLLSHRQRRDTCRRIRHIRWQLCLTAPPSTRTSRAPLLRPLLFAFCLSTPAPGPWSVS